MNEEIFEDPAAEKSAAKSLEKGFENVTTPEQAARILDQLEQIPAEIREEDFPGHRLSARQQAKKIRGGHDRTAETLKSAAEAIAEGETAEQPEMDAAVGEAAGTGEEERRPAQVRKGHQLLRAELVRRLKPLDAIDASIFIGINNLPHPKPADRFMASLTKVMTGGHGWLIPLAAAIMVDRRRGWRAAVGVLPVLWLTTATVEYGIKPFFRRKRPFISIVRAIVVGRKPGSHSFPSGHSAAAFAGATLLSRHYPRQWFLFRGVALLTAFSRIYLGAHYPGDVASGSLLGIGLSRGFSRLLGRNPKPTGQ